MKNSLFIILSLFLHISLFSQQIRFNWQQCSGIIEKDISFDIVTTPGGYLVCSNRLQPENATNPGMSYIWITKINLQGEIIWEKYFQSGQAFRLKKANDNIYFIIATTSRSDGDVTYDPYPDSRDFWIIKIDSIGTKVWDKIVGGTGYDLPNDGDVTSDGGIVIVGNIGSPDGNPDSYVGDASYYYGFWDFWVIKLDSDGNKVWDFTLGSLWLETGIAITATSDGGCIAGGAVDSDPGGSVECYNQDIQAVLVKLNADGVQEWQKCYGSSDDDVVHCILETSDGYIIGAATSYGDLDVEGAGYHLGYDHLGNSTYDIWIYKIDKSGNKLWGKCFGGSKLEFPDRLFQTSTGDIVVFGETFSIDGDITNNHHGFGQFKDIWMLKLTGEGDLLWQRCIGTWGDQSIEKGVVMLDDYNFVVAANTVNGGVDDITCGVYPNYTTQYEDAWVFSITDSAGISGIGYQETLASKIKLYPNPATDYIALEIPPEFEMINTQADILDVSGKILKSVELTGHKPYLYTGDLPGGLYLLRLINKQGFVSKRFVKLVN